MIRGKKVILRTFQESDLEFYLELINDLSNLTPYWPAYLRTVTDLRKEFGENGFWKEDYKLMLLTDRSGGLIGELDAFKTSPNIQGVEVGFRIFEGKNMGKGYMTEALNLFSAYLFTANPIMPRLTLMIRTDNKGSIRVAEKCNYQPEGTLRNAWVDDGKPYSMEIYSLLREECPKIHDLIQ